MMKCDLDLIYIYIFFLAHSFNRRTECGRRGRQLGFWCWYVTSDCYIVVKHSTFDIIFCLSSNWANVHWRTGPCIMNILSCMVALAFIWLFNFVTLFNEVFLIELSVCIVQLRSPTLDVFYILFYVAFSFLNDAQVFPDTKLWIYCHAFLSFFLFLKKVLDFISMLHKRNGKIGVCMIMLSRNYLNFWVRTFHSLIHHGHLYLVILWVGMVL